MNIGQRINSLRRRIGMSQQEVETSCGIKREYLSKLESGVLDNPTVKTLKRIAGAIGVTLSELVSDSVALSENSNLNCKIATQQKEIAQLKLFARGVAEAAAGLSKTDIGVFDFRDGV